MAWYISLPLPGSTAVSPRGMETEAGTEPQTVPALTPTPALPQRGGELLHTDASSNSLTGVLVAKTGDQHPHGPLAHGIRL